MSNFCAGSFEQNSDIGVMLNQFDVLLADANEIGQIEISAILMRGLASALVELGGAEACSGLTDFYERNDFRGAAKAMRAHIVTNNT